MKASKKALKSIRTIRIYNTSRLMDLNNDHIEETEFFAFKKNNPEILIAAIEDIVKSRRCGKKQLPF